MESIADHVIDFFVIAGADLFAAWIVWKYIEKRQRRNEEKSRKAEERLSNLSASLARLSSWVNARIEGFKNSGGDAAVHLDGLDGWKDEASGLAENVSFWAFEDGTELKAIFKVIISVHLSVIGSRTVGQAKGSLSELRHHLDLLQSKIQERM